MGMDNFIFQQDGAPCHKFKVTIDYFERNNIALLPWAA